LIIDCWEEAVNDKARSSLILSGLVSNNPGDFLLSHTVTRAVPSAPAGLTSVFGMGTGVTLPTKSPENRFEISNLRFEISDFKKGLRESNSDVCFSLGKFRASAKLVA
jgi:hypothetical protein